jgi:hypothetical protein
VTIRLSRVLSELRREHDIGSDELVPYALVSQRLADLLRAQCATASAEEPDGGTHVPTRG